MDSGATCHICCDETLFDELDSDSTEITLGDGTTITSTGKGTVHLTLINNEEEDKDGVLSDVLYVPALSFNLLSVSRVTENGKKATFYNDMCDIRDNDDESLVATASKQDNLYYLKCIACKPQESINSLSHSTGVNLWHRRYGHLNVPSLAREELVYGLKIDDSKDADVCESCIKGKIHRLPFPTTGGKELSHHLNCFTQTYVESSTRSH